MELLRSLNTAHRQAHELAQAPVVVARSPRRDRLHVALRRLALCIVAVWLIVFAAGPVASAHAITMTKPEKKLMTLVNHMRAKHHLHQLSMVASLQRASRAHSRQMVRRGYFSHNSASGESVGARLIRFGYTTSGCTRWTVGENIAYGYQASGTPHAIFMAWWHSPAHRRVMLTKRFRNLGIGRASGTFKGIDGIVFFTLDCGARTS
jgi:uncharacterized protein YkwD